eukprot:TRINITY_DN5016_c2_g1_i1.p1 TRINITY_DN5016_c2_g1~~TRINITY_DN5016_c2_g1_i1.p1  ORF type:complete len:1525 (+),score=308.28 TRINITY_DN5016_c2_g1_i1:135-4577(+)
MGNKLAAPTAPIDYYLHDLVKVIVKDQTLGNGRFLKSIKCQHTAYDEGTIVVKVYVKQPGAALDLKEQETQLKEINAFLSSTANPNVMPYQKFFETEKAAYLIRQYIKHSLYDRIGTRPFLTTIEKKWIAYQSLKAVYQAHFYGICHGDIKCENFLLTSWSWLYLTDFASYKPTNIPEDDPLDFHYFFNTGERATCYIAPERFHSSSTLKNPKLNRAPLEPAMDIFSLGCCIAELFLEGVSDPLFSFSQLLSYRKGEYDPMPVIEKIKDEAAQSLIKHMIQKDPTQRFAIGKYLDSWSPQLFPSYFPFLHSYMARLMLMDADQKIATIHKQFDEIRKNFMTRDSSPEALLNSDDSEGHAGASSSSSEEPALLFPLTAPSTQKDNSFSKLLETEQFVARIHGERDGPVEQRGALGSATKRTHTSIIRRKDKEALKEATHNSVIMDTINADTLTLHPSSLPTTTTATTVPEGCEGFVMILDVVCASVRNVRTVLSRLTALDIFQKLIPYLDDKCRLQRVVPYVITLLSDTHVLIRATALRTLTKVLDKVTHFPPGDSHIFPEYILPALADFHTAKEEIVREAFAENLAQLAEIARRFLEASQFFKQVSMSELSPSLEWGTGDRGTTNVIRSQAYDAELAEIQDPFYDFVIRILTEETSPLVKRCLLMDITRLCIFFGRERTCTKLLQYIITHEILNGNGPWELRAAFFHNIVGVSAFVGIDELEKYILPCINHALTDEEEFVIDKAVNCFASLCELGLFRKQILFNIAEETVAMLLHPNTWIRFGVVAVMAAIAKHVGVADVFANLIPILRPFLLSDIIDITEATILECLKSPVSREAFDNTVASMKYEEESRPPSQSCMEPTPQITKVLFGRRYGPVPQDEAFDSNVMKQNIAPEEKEKLLLMKSYLKSLARRKLSGKLDNETSPVVNTDKYTHLSRSGIPIYSPSFPPGGIPSLVDPTTQPELKLRSDIPDMNFGSLHRMDNNTSTALNSETLQGWQPKGVLIAHLHEHRMAVNRVKASRDNLFFVTCSDDGAVKIWDTQRLEKNVTNRARLSYHSQGGSIKDITICENSHSIAAASDNGSIHVLRVDYTRKVQEGANHRYKGVSTLRQDKTDGAVICIDHFNSGAQSVLVYGTTRGSVNGWDLRDKKEIFSLSNSARLGLLRSFIVDKDRNWLVTVTARGYFTCWDLRFNIPIKVWRHPNKDMVYRIMQHPLARYRSHIFSASGNNQVDVWNIETGELTQHYRVLSGEETPLAPVAAQLSPHALDFGVQDQKPRPITDELEPSVLAMYTPPDCSYLLTAGTDRRIRLWNHVEASRSYTINGLSEDECSVPPRYSTRLYEGNAAVVYQEQPSLESTINSRIRGLNITAPGPGGLGGTTLPPGTGGGSGGSTIGGSSNSSGLATATTATTATTTTATTTGSGVSGGVSGGVGGGGGAAAAAAARVRPAPDHHAAILDLECLELPHRMLISAARDGVVKVWK